MIKTHRLTKRSCIEVALANLKKKYIKTLSNKQKYYNLNLSMNQNVSRRERKIIDTHQSSASFTKRDQ